MASAVEARRRFHRARPNLLQHGPTRPQTARCNVARPIATAHGLFAQVVEERRRIVLSQVEEEMRWQEEKAAELARQRSAQHRTEFARCNNPHARTMRRNGGRLLSQRAEAGALECHCYCCNYRHCLWLTVTATLS